MRSKITVLLALGALLVSGAATSAPPPGAKTSVSGLRCEYAVDPVGIDVAQPRLGWMLESPQRGQRQTAYQVLVAGTEAKLKANRGDLWDSGKVPSDQSAHVVYAGKEPGSRQRCYWKVRVWDKDGRPSAYSRPADWEMGLLRSEDWQAKWIAFTPGQERQPVVAGSFWIWHAADPDNPPSEERFFRRQVTVPEGSKVKHARFYLAADDQFTLFVNGKEAGKNSGWEQVRAVEIKEHLRPGSNVLAIAAGNGIGPAGVIGHLEIELESGPPITLSTDRGWKTSSKAQPGWQNAGFNDGGWTPAKEIAKFGGGVWGTLQLSGNMGPCPHLRKGFTLSRPVRQARLYATALGVYECRLNGERVGQDIFAPGWTDYRKRVQYQIYDVTSMLRKGENALGIILGDGWYSGHVGLGGRNRYGTTPLALCQLMVEYTDGSTETVVTDGTWKGSTGPLLESDMLMGETYDARKEIPGWDRSGFTEAGWQPVSLREAPKEMSLEAERGPAVRKTQELKARKVTEPVKGRFVFDLGQNMVGWARLKVQGDPGTQVTLRFAEMLNPDGTIYTTNYRGARCTDRYTLKGGWEEVYEPRFTFRGFQYVEVTGYPGVPSPEAITGIVVHSATPPSGKFACSSPMVNQLQSNIVWGQRGNFLSVPTDCPQRDERLGWTGDAQIFVRTATFNMDVAGFFTKWLIDLDDAQTPEGAYPDVAPRVAVGAGTAAWGDAGVICPWTIYLAYGDRRILEDHYTGMAKWIEYCKNHSNGLLRPAEGYGDWLNIKDETPKDVLATAYFAYTTHLMAETARVLNRAEDAKKYEDLFQQIRAAFNQAYVGPDARIKGNTQTAYVLALQFGLLPDEKREVAAKHLVEHIRSREWHLSTGFVGVGYLLPTLTRFGHLDVAYRLLNNDTFPSWGYSIKYGATTIWERWDGWTKERGFQDPGMNSFNHYSLGSVGEWLYHTVAGIGPDPDQPGYKHAIIRPRPGGGLTYARGEYQSLYGRIASDWKVEKGTLHLAVTIPANTTATVYVPAAEGSRILESGKPVEKAEGVRLLRREGDSAVFTAGSGSYSFTAPYQGRAVAGGR
jgi:alpha-L-rhamnosidase